MASVCVGRTQHAWSLAVRWVHCGMQDLRRAVSLPGSHVLVGFPSSSPTPLAHGGCNLTRVVFELSTHLCSWVEIWSFFQPRFLPTVSDLRLTCTVTTATKFRIVGVIKFLRFDTVAPSYDRNTDENGHRVNVCGTYPTRMVSRGPLGPLRHARSPACRVTAGQPCARWIPLVEPHTPGPLRLKFNEGGF